MNNERLKEIVNRFNENSVVVLGDVVIDSYVYGKPRGHNPDKDGKPLITVQKESLFLGGGGNSAANVASLGGSCVFYTAVGNDSNSEIVKGICEKNGIVPFFVREGDTIVKRRVLTNDGEYMARVDHGEQDLNDLSEESKKQNLENIKEKNPKVILLSDYNKRLFRGNLSESIIAYAKRNNIKVMVDPKPVNSNKFKGSFLFCPNLKEAKEMIGDINDFEEIAKRVREKSGCENVIVTLKDKGLICYDGWECKIIPSYARNVEDTMGAGDTLKAGIALALAAEANIFDAAEIGSHAVAIAVERKETTVVKYQELLDRIEKEL